MVFNVWAVPVPANEILEWFVRFASVGALLPAEEIRGRLAAMVTLWNFTGQELSQVDWVVIPTHGGFFDYCGLACDGRHVVTTVQNGPPSSSISRRRRLAFGNENIFAGPQEIVASFRRRPMEITCGPAVQSDCFKDY